jgi:Protein of unknown function (DUF732)
MFVRHDIAKLVGTAMAVAVLGLVTSGNAAADPTEDAFIRTLLNHGLYFGSPTDVILRAHGVCKMFSDGMSAARVHATMVDQFEQTWTPRQNALFMADAVQAYCPKYADLFTTEAQTR